MTDTEKLHKLTLAAYDMLIFVGALSIDLDLDPGETILNIGGNYTSLDTCIHELGKAVSLAKGMPLREALFSIHEEKEKISQNENNPYTHFDNE